MKRKRIFAAILACAFICKASFATEITYHSASFITASAAAEESGKLGETITWELDDDGTLTLSGSGAIPSFIYQLPKEKIKNIIISNGITSIGESAFCKCINLTSVTLSDSITSISNNAFSNCTSLTSITIPDSVTSIGDGAFDHTPWLEEQRKKNPLVIVNDILIDGNMCQGAVVIPDNVISICGRVFYNCTSLTSITIPDSVTSIGDSTFRNCASLTSIIIPDSITSIGDYAFADCIDLESITIPDSVTSIGFSAFEYCTSLKSITIPDSVASIEDLAFCDCTNLESITIKNPACVIADSSDEIPDTKTIPDTATIYGYAGSTAEAYASKYHKKFATISDTPITTTPAPTTTTQPSDVLLGDANCDGRVDIADVVSIKCYLINSKDYSITKQGLINADVNESGNGINVQDSLAFLKYILKLIDSL